MLSTDDEKFGGKGIKNNKVYAKQDKNKKLYITVDIPPLSTIYFYKKASQKKGR